jgi:hypothetical protein
MVEIMPVCCTHAFGLDASLHRDAPHFRNRWRYGPRSPTTCIVINGTGMKSSTGNTLRTARKTAPTSSPGMLIRRRAQLAPGKFASTIVIVSPWPHRAQRVQQVGGEQRINTAQHLCVSFNSVGRERQ